MDVFREQASLGLRTEELAPEPLELLPLLLVLLLQLFVDMSNATTSSGLIAAARSRSIMCTFYRIRRLFPSSIPSSTRRNASSLSWHVRWVPGSEKRPRSSRLANRQKPVRSQKTSFR